MEAASELLVAQGLAGITTNGIAQRAGVSVGSVYRYFADKEAIVTEIARRRRNRNATRLKHAIGEGGPLEEVMRRIVEQFIVVGEKEFAVRRVLIEEVPAGWLSKSALDAWSEAEAAVSALLKGHLPSLSDEEAKMRAFIAIHAVDGVTRGTAIRRDAASLGAVVDALMKTLLPYLQAPQ